MTEAAENKWTFVLDEPTRVLMVDDDPILREFAIVNLSTPVAAIETAPDGQTGLERLLNEKFDIALFDIEMPGMNGWQLVEQVRSHESLRHLPIVMLTSRDDINSIDQAYRAGATSFVTKPVNWRLLSYQVRYVLRASRMEAEARRAQASAEATAALKARALGLVRNELSATVNAVAELADLIVAHGGNLEAPGSEAGYAAKISEAKQELLGRVARILVESPEDDRKHPEQPRTAA